MFVQLYVQPVKAQAAAVDMTLSAIGIGNSQWGSSDTAFMTWIAEEHKEEYEIIGSAKSNIQILI